MNLNAKLATVAMFGLVFVTGCGANTATNMNANVETVPATIEVNANGMTNDIMMNTNSMMMNVNAMSMSGAMMNEGMMMDAMNANMNISLY